MVPLYKIKGVETYRKQTGLNMVRNKDELEKTTKRSKHYKLHKEKPASSLSARGKSSPGRSTKSPRKDHSIESGPSNNEGEGGVSQMTGRKDSLYEESTMRGVI